MGVVPGLRARLSIAVGEGDTAIAAGSGDVPVFATPRLLALAEAACVAAISNHLDHGTTSVGTSVSLEHRRACLVGTEVTVEAELTEVDGRRLVFGFVARLGTPEAQAPDGDDEDTVLGGGTAERVVVDREKFLARAAAARHP